jgi:3-oxoacyl-[acyl-carrier protein] reductase
MERIVYKKVLVAGGCGGIGRAVVDALRAAGAEVAVLDLAASIERHPVPQGVKAIALDASREEGVTEAFKSLSWKEAHGFVNLVGFMAPLQPLATMSAQTWDVTVAGNLRAAFLLARAAVPLLRASGQGSLVNVSSGLALRAAAGYGPYAASKAGMISLTKTIAVEHAPQVRANAVAPAVVDTEFLRGGTGREARGNHIDFDAYVKMIPLGRIATADDVVGPILFLLGPGSAYMTGQVLYINGGMITP